jgi:hypothetical protein
MMMPIRCGELRSGIGSVLSGRTLVMKIFSRGVIAARAGQAQRRCGPSSSSFRVRANGSAPTGRANARPDDRLRRGPMTGSARTSDVQLHIGESRDSGSGPSDHPGMTRVRIRGRSGKKPISRCEGRRRRVSIAPHCRRSCAWTSSRPG